MLLVQLQVNNIDHYLDLGTQRLLIMSEIKSISIQLRYPWHIRWKSELQTLLIYLVNSVSYKVKQTFEKFLDSVVK